ncbi:MAG TPA: alkaline phosphatase family protein [Kineosporiaceae bacterium]|nr:alkaline phosphatase family protein [Kineosporiaceae bacterium]
MRRTRVTPVLAAGCAAAALALLGGPSASAAPSSQASSPARSGGHAPRVLGPYKHLVVIYEENHSFDNLYGSWGRVGGQRVDGLRNARPRTTVQVAQDGTPYRCLLQDDVNLTSPPLPSRCSDPAHGVAASAFRNRPFTIDRYIRPQDTTCPAPGVFAPNGVPKGQGLPGGCTRDLVHRFYQEQYQRDGGRQDRYVTGSDAVGLTMGHYDTKQLPIYRYLHSAGAPNYVIADRFFQAAFGGSFLNHQYLVAARAPIDTAPTADLHSIVDANGFPNDSYPLYKPTTKVADKPLTQACGPTANPAVACGDYAVNTMQPANAPSGKGDVLPLVDATKYPTIGDRLMAAGVSWNWYSGGWADAASGHPGPLFQYHHQPLNYFSSFAPGQPGREHLRDEKEFVAAAEKGTLPTVSFVKPYGAENEHPGYASEPDGSDHLVDLLKTITSGPQADDTLVVVTYDEFGGQWDHVSPPGTGRTRGVHDEFGPGTRIPALILSASLRRSGVDHTVYDTTSILATIEHGLHLAPLSSRDARVPDLRNALAVGGVRRH